MTPLVPVVAALIATCNRPGLLAQRALTSVQRQSRQPDILVVVDDSDAAMRPDNRNIVNDLRLGNAKIIYLTNWRGRGAAGAWNTGLEWIRRHVDDPHAVFVAVLDDDDEWEPDHLSSCVDAVAAGPFDMVASGITRLTSSESPRDQSPPVELRAGLFLVGNPHIQGSNLFVRLSSLLWAGAFDESLQSCTDRDLCIRLADLGSVRYTSIARSTVRHYADTSRSRLSSPTANPKKLGLDRFWHKWNGRMSETERAACLERAQRLFDWRPTLISVNEPAVGPLVVTPEPVESRVRHGDDISLVVGIISDDDHVNQIHHLLVDLLDLQSFEQICSLDVVVLINGGTSGALVDLLSGFRSRGLTIFAASEKQQSEDARSGLFGAGFTRGSGRAAIGPARTMVQGYVTRVVKQRVGAVAWIIDDDSRLANVTDGREVPAFRTLLSSLKQMQALDSDIVLGAVTGDPPVPPGSTVRTQMVDLLHNLSWLSNLNPIDQLPDRREENRTARTVAKDYYYDLSRRDTHHLEWPFWLTPAVGGETVAAATARMIKRLPRILAGQAVFRQLVLEANCDIIASMRPSVQRGSNTFVFDCAAFADFPNAAPTFAGDVLRRSDMIWALLNRYAGGRRIVTAKLPIRHDRDNEKPVGLDLVRLIPDIRGYALYSALEDMLVRRRERRLRHGEGAEVKDDLQFRDSDLDLGYASFKKYLRERTASLISSCWRIQGVCDAVEHLMPEIEFRLFTADSRGLVESLRAFLKNVRSGFAVDDVQKVVDRVVNVGAEEVRSFLNGLGDLVDRHQKAKVPPVQDDRWFHAERLKSATPLAQGIAGEAPLRLLGQGSEGVVFLGGANVIKIIDYSKRSAANGSRDGVKLLASSGKEPGALYRLETPPLPGSRLAICYRHESSEPYRGGRATEIARLIQSCVSVRVVTSNLHPKNLIVSPQGVRLIDYGADIRVLTEDGLRSMTQRAWLTFRFHDRADLASLMRSALKDQDLPELEGWESMIAAIDPITKLESVDDALADIIRPWRPRRVLDYGCGHGRLAAALAADGADVVAYDPDSSLADRWRRHPVPTVGRVRWSSGDADPLRESAVGSFDLVVSSLVLCVIEDDGEYKRAVHAIAKALAPTGRFLILICNPAATFSGDSTIQKRLIDRTAAVKGTFVWTKELPSGTRRKDVHRDEAKLCADLSEAGLTIEFTSTTGGLTAGDLTPSSDFLILVGSKAPGTNAIARPNRTPVRAAHRRPIGVPVLAYHRVLPRDLDDDITRLQRKRGTVVDVDVFARQMDELSRTFSPLTLTQYFDWLDGALDVSPQSCLVTFDDGYRDFAEYALPILRDRGIPAVLFPTMSAARHIEPLPADSLYCALGRAEASGRIDAASVAEWLTGEKKRRFIRADRNGQREILLSEGWDADGVDPKDLYLGESDLAALPADLISLGGHGVRHELMSQMSLPALRAEMRRIRFWLEGLNANRGERRLALAYPNGNFSDRAIAAVIEGGFAAAFSVLPWRPELREHRWRLRRACIPNSVRAIGDLAAGSEVKI